MLVSFWSPYHGQTGTTLNSISTAVIMSLNYNLKVLLTHSQYIKSNMEGAFYNDNEQVDIINFKDIGIDSIQRLARAKKLQPSDFKNYTKSIIENRLDLLTGSTKPYKELYDTIYENLITILECANRTYDMVIVDVNSGKYDKVTKKVLEESDVIVVNINQNERLIKSLFEDEEWSQIFDNKKKIIVVGRYDKNSKCTTSYIERTYKYKDKVYTVPYSCDFMDANNNHNVVKFFKSNSRDNISNKENAFFMSEVDKIAERLTDMLEMEKEEKEDIKDPIRETSLIKNIKSIFE